MSNPTNYLVRNQDLSQIFLPYTGVPGTESPRIPNYSVNGTNVWNQSTAGNQQWRSITSSSSGQYLAACVNGISYTPGMIYFSTDYGNTWTTSNSPTGYWSSVASSSDGSRMIACCDFTSGSSPFNNMYVSTDSGRTWTVSSGPTGSVSFEQYLQCVTSNSSGTFVATCAAGGSIWRNGNYGLSANWARVDNLIGNWISITSSSDGTILAACSSNNIFGGSGIGYIYTSTNSGAGWTQIAYNSTNFSPLNSTWNTGNVWGWQCITSSSDGRYVAACINNQQYYHSRDAASGNFSGPPQPGYPYGIWVSTNYGTTWTQTNANPYAWYCIKFSSCGQYLVATTNNKTFVSQNDISGNGIWLSRNYGASGSWVQINTNTSINWSGITISSSGQYITACSFGDTIYRYSMTIDIGNLFAVSLTGNLTANPINYITPGTNVWSNSSSQVVGLNFNSITSSYNGQYLAACVSGGGIYISNNYGNTWTLTNQPPPPPTPGSPILPTPSNPNWQSITSSSNGQYLSAVIFYNDRIGGIWNSNNYGITWTNSTGGGVVQHACVTSSSSGQYVFVGTHGSGIYLSNNYGGDTGWVGGAQLSRTWTGVAISSNGQYLAACAVASPTDSTKDWIYLSNDVGANFITQTSTVNILNAPWNCISISGSGQYLAAGINNTQGVETQGIWYTTDYATGSNSRTWLQSDAPAGEWCSIAQSKSGQYLSAVNYRAGIWVSSNYGANWRKLINPPLTTLQTLSWISIASSSSGQNLAVCSRNEGSALGSGINTYSINMDIGNIFAPLVPFTSTTSSNIVYTYTYQSNQYVITFTNPTNSTSSNTASITFTQDISTATIIVVGGGGGGAGRVTLGEEGGGGGGGGVSTASSQLTGTYNITIGNGGSQAQQGSSSSFTNSSNVVSCSATGGSGGSGRFGGTGGTGTGTGGGSGGAGGKGFRYYPEAIATSGENGKYINNYYFGGGGGGGGYSASANQQEGAGGLGGGGAIGRGPGGQSSKGNNSQSYTGPNGIFYPAAYNSGGNGWPSTGGGGGGGGDIALSGVGGAAGSPGIVVIIFSYP